MSSSRLVSLIVGIALAIVVPLLFGAHDFGKWVVFRSLIVLLTGQTTPGLAAVMSVQYVSRVVNNQAIEAARLFKTVVIVRLVMAVIVAIGGYFMVSAVPTFTHKTWVAWCLVSSLVLTLTSSTFILLLHGERDYSRLAIAKLMQQCVIPAAVIPAYLMGGFAWVPAGCAAGEALNVIVFFMLTRRYFSWPAGWLPRSEWKLLGHFTGSVSLYAAGRKLMSNAVPCLMGVSGIDSTQIGYVGLASRVSQLIQGSLQQASVVMLPSTKVVLEREGPDKFIVWRSFICRMGSLVTMAATGAFLIIGSRITPLIWGHEYAGAAVIISVVLAAITPRWIGSDHCQLLIVIGKPIKATKSIVWMLLFFLICFLLCVPDHGALGASMAILVGNAAFMIGAMTYSRNVLGKHLGLQRLLLPCLLTVMAFFVGKQLESMTALLVAVLLWGTVFLGAAFFSGSVSATELKQVLGHLRNAAKVGPRKSE
jgi:O-antigen/teichoic acid export membrane protein